MLTCPVAMPHRAMQAQAARLRRGDTATARDALGRHGTALLLPGEPQRCGGSAAASRRGEANAVLLASMSLSAPPRSGSSRRPRGSSVGPDREGDSSSPSLMSDSPPPRLTTPAPPRTAADAASAAPAEARGGRRLHRANIGSGSVSTAPYRSRIRDQHTLCIRAFRRLKCAPSIALQCVPATARRELPLRQPRTLDNTEHVRPIAAEG